ncbi:velvet protein [Ascosphaera aggregata]|nr:velvet protein [Ascosphaera aggregata]
MAFTHHFILTNESGNIISYALKIIQQPYQARACGFGSKSAADRRPVDPPPVVELHIYSQFASNAPSIEVTANHNTNFFLYAQLETEHPPPTTTEEQASTGQGSTAVVSKSTAKASTADLSVSSLLLGVPVSGVSYLDRPEKAGYFYFPDLSIKKNGSYRLHFYLYEEIQEPESSSIIFRGSVRSDVFHVFSAREFPDLMESTAISRTLAEQGCRVGIRRGRTRGKANSSRKAK